MSNEENKTNTIKVASIYSKGEREEIKAKLKARIKELGVGMPRFLDEILRQVEANNKRIEKIDGHIGLYTDQLSVKNMYHFFEGRRSDDARVQILDAYLQIMERNASAVE